MVTHISNTLYLEIKLIFDDYDDDDDDDDWLTCFEKLTYSPAGYCICRSVCHGRLTAPSFCGISAIKGEKSL